jgi:integrase
MTCKGCYLSVTYGSEITFGLPLIMAHLKLTEIGIQGLKPPSAGQVDYFDKHLASFGLRVSSKGAKAFFVMTRVHGKLIRVTLGRHPALTLKDARAKAGNVIELASSGTDPREVEDDRKRRAREAAGNTFETVAHEFMSKYARVRLRPNTIAKYEQALFGSATKHLATQPLSKIGRRDIIVIMDGFQERRTLTAADRALACLRKFFNWAADREYIDHSPVNRIRPIVGLTQRERSLSKEEIGFIWRAFEQEECHSADSRSVFAFFLKVLLLTAQRRSEVAEMRWEELQALEGEAPLWIMPKAPPPPADQRTKNGRPHVVPLSPIAAEILKSVPRTSSQYVFSSNGATPISGFSKLKTRIDSFIAAARKSEGVPPIAAWQFRDLRRTASTHMNDFLGVESHVVEAILNHVSGPAKRGVAGTYNKAFYLEDRRKAMRLWSDYILACL